MLLPGAQTSALSLPSSALKIRVSDPSQHKSTCLLQVGSASYPPGLEAHVCHRRAQVHSFLVAVQKYTQNAFNTIAREEAKQGPTPYLWMSKLLKQLFRAPTCEVAPPPGMCKAVQLSAQPMHVGSVQATHVRSPRPPHIKGIAWFAVHEVGHTTCTQTPVPPQCALVH